MRRRLRAKIVEAVAVGDEGSVRRAGVVGVAIVLRERVAPPMPAFYHKPQTIDDIVNQTVNRVLDLADIELPQDLFTRWQGGKESLD